MPGARRWLPLALRLVVLVAIAIGVAVTVRALGLDDVAALRSRVSDAGLSGMALFVGAYAMVTLAPLPKNALSAAAGLLFGLVTGVLVVLVAATIGAAAAFWLGRVLGRDSVARFLGPRVRRVDGLVRRRGFLSILALRLVPVVPFTLLNYGAGLSAVRFRDYLLATVVGIVPGTVAYVALGAYGASPRSWQFATAVAVLGLLTVGGALAARRHRRRERPGQERPADSAPPTTFPAP